MKRSSDFFHFFYLCRPFVLHGLMIDIIDVKRGEDSIGWNGTLGVEMGFEETQTRSLSLFNLPLPIFRCCRITRTKVTTKLHTIKLGKLRIELDTYPLE